MPLHEAANPSVVLGLHPGQCLYGSLSVPLEHNLENLPFVSHEFVLQGDEHHTSGPQMAACQKGGCLPGYWVQKLVECF